MVLPGNLSVTLVSTPDSVARGCWLVSLGGEGGERRGEERKGGEGGKLLESAVLMPCFAW